MSNTPFSSKNANLTRGISPEDLEKLTELSDHLLDKYGVSLSSVLKKAELEKPRIPCSIFVKQLGAFEAIVRYFRDVIHLSNKRIAELTDRKENTLSTAYKKSYEKYHQELSIVSRYTIPVSLLKNRKLSVLENICCYLKEEYGLSYKEIGELLHRDMKTIWTVVARARKK